jgi:hypothetical protein
MRPSDDSPRSSIDDVINVYKQSVDRTLIREMLKLTPAQRMVRLQKLKRAADELKRAGEKLRRK